MWAVEAASKVFRDCLFHFIRSLIVLSGKAPFKHVCRESKPPVILKAPAFKNGGAFRMTGGFVSKPNCLSFVLCLFSYSCTKTEWQAPRTDALLHLLIPWSPIVLLTCKCANFKILFSCYSSLMGQWVAFIYLLFLISCFYSGFSWWLYVHRSVIKINICMWLLCDMALLILCIF